MRENARIEERGRARAYEGADGRCAVGPIGESVLQELEQLQILEANSPYFQFEAFVVKAPRVVGSGYVALYAGFAPNWCGDCESRSEDFLDDGRKFVRKE